MTNTEMEARITRYVELLTEATNEHFAAHLENLTPPVYTMDKGRRYVRIVKNETFGSGRSVHTFIDTTNGDVLKADSWKAPAKHPRGNVFNDDNGMGGCSVWGGNYLR